MNRTDERTEIDFEGLQRRLQGKVHSEATMRWLYSTDASIYQIQPAGVVVPKSVEDLDATLAFAREQGLSITARGGGTSLGGQAVGAGLLSSGRPWIIVKCGTVNRLCPSCSEPAATERKDGKRV